MHVIKEVKPTDEGLYTCIAGNFIGQATASAYLEVNSGRVHSGNGLFLLLTATLLIVVNVWQTTRSTSR